MPKTPTTDQEIHDAEVARVEKLIARLRRDGWTEVTTDPKEYDTAITKLPGFEYREFPTVLGEDPVFDEPITIYWYRPRRAPGRDVARQPAQITAEDLRARSTAVFEWKDLIHQLEGGGWIRKKDAPRELEQQIQADPRYMQRSFYTAPPVTIGGGLPRVEVWLFPNLRSPNVRSLPDVPPVQHRAIPRRKPTRTIRDASTTTMPPTRGFTINTPPLVAQSSTTTSKIHDVIDNLAGSLSRSTRSSDRNIASVLRLANGLARGNTGILGKHTMTPPYFPTSGPGGELRTTNDPLVFDANDQDKIYEFILGTEDQVEAQNRNFPLDDFDTDAHPDIRRAAVILRNAGVDPDAEEAVGGLFNSGLTPAEILSKARERTSLYGRAADLARGLGIDPDAEMAAGGLFDPTTPDQEIFDDIIELNTLKQQGAAHPGASRNIANIRQTLRDLPPIRSIDIDDFFTSPSRTPEPFDEDLRQLWRTPPISDTGADTRGIGDSIAASFLADVAGVPIAAPLIKAIIPDIPIVGEVAGIVTDIFNDLFD